MAQLVHCFGDQLSSVVSGIQKGSAGGTLIQASYYAFLLKKTAKLSVGEYFYDSCFYDTAEYTARLNEATIAKVQEKPQDWALVFFDYHF